MCYGILYWAIHRWRTTYLQTISYTSYEILSSGFLLMQYFVWSRLWHFGVTFGSRLWHFWCRSCAHSCTDRNASQFLFLEILLKYQVTNWWLKNLLMWSNKEADFSPEINKSFTFPGMGHLFSELLCLDFIRMMWVTLVNGAATLRLDSTVLYRESFQNILMRYVSLFIQHLHWKHPIHWRLSK